MYDKNIFLRILKGIHDTYDVASLSEDFTNKLKPEDAISSAAGSSANDDILLDDILLWVRNPINRSLRTLPPTPLSKCLTLIVDKYVEDEEFRFIPNRDISTWACKQLLSRIGFAFRYLPVLSRFQEREIECSTSLLDMLSSWYHDLGFSLRSSPLSSDVLYSSSSAGAGLRGLENPGSCVSNILVEVITATSGSFGRYFALISWGVSCTIWYAVEPCSMGHMPDSSLFGPLFINDYTFHVGYKPPAGFKVIQFVQHHDVTSSVESAFREKPFSDFQVTAGSCALTNSVKLGVMLTFALATGRVPGL